MTNNRPNLREIIRRAIEAAPLPTTLDALSTGDRARLDAFAATHGLDSAEALTLARDAQRAAIAEARHLDDVAASARRSRS